MIKKVIRKIKGIIRIKKLNKNNNCNIDLKANVDNTNIIEFNNIGRNTTIINSEIGEYSYLGSNCVFSNVKIGRFCSIANNIKVICGAHPSNTFVSTSPYFYKTINNNIKTINNDVEYKEFEYCDQDNKFLCIIGNDVWIGENVQILQGVKIGDGAIIGANSLITKNIEPYSIVGGVPAKIIKYRFKKEEINFLCELKWWDKEISWIKKYSKYFNNVEELIQILNKEKEVKYHDKEN